MLSLPPSITEYFDNKSYHTAACINRKWKEIIYRSQIYIRQYIDFENFSSASLLKHPQNIYELCINSISVTPKLIEFITQLINIRYLTLFIGRDIIIGEGGIILPNSLHMLCMGGLSNLEFKNALPNSIRYLTLRQFQLPKLNHPLPPLQELYIEECKYHPDWLAALYNTPLRKLVWRDVVLPEFPNPEILEYVQISNVTTMHLMPELKTVWIENPDPGTIDNIIANCPKLNNYLISGPHVQDISKLRKVGTLRTLVVKDVTEDLFPLAAMKQITLLIMACDWTDEAEDLYDLIDCHSVCLAHARRNGALKEGEYYWGF